MTSRHDHISYDPLGETDFKGDPTEARDELVRLQAINQQQPEQQEKNMTLPSDVVNKSREFIKAQKNVMRAKQEFIRAEAVLKECRLDRQCAAIGLRNAEGLKEKPDRPTYLQVDNCVLKIPRIGSIKLLKISK